MTSSPRRRAAASSLNRNDLSVVGKAIEYEDLPWSEPEQFVVSNGRLLDCLEYMQQVEYHTAWYLRSSLSSSVLIESDLTDFLIGWAFEETHHGIALGRVLDMNGRSTWREEAENIRSRLAGQMRRQQFLFALAQYCRFDLLPVHMTVGALNEWTAQAAYLRFAEHVPGAGLKTLAKRIAYGNGTLCPTPISGKPGIPGNGVYANSDPYGALIVSASIYNNCGNDVDIVSSSNITIA